MPGQLTPLRRDLLLAAFKAILFALAVGLPRCVVFGQSDVGYAGTSTPITISADFSHEWQDGRDFVAILRGRCRVVQGSMVLHAQKMVVWQQTDSIGRSRRDRLTVYLEDDARMERPGQSVGDSSLFVTLVSTDGATFEIRNPMNGQPAARDALFRRALERRRRAKRVSVQQTQFVTPEDELIGPELQSVQIQQPARRSRRIQILPRSQTPLDWRSWRSEESTPPEQVTVITGGINILIHGVEDVLEADRPIGVVDLSADRMVIWTRADIFEDSERGSLQSDNEPFQVYMEGNIEIRQGDRLIRAERAIYDAKEDRALLLDAELKAFVPRLQGDIRLRAKRLRQLSRESYHAQNAWITTSPYGKPGYRLQSTDIFLENRYPEPLFGGGSVEFDPMTGAPIVEPTPWVTALNNTFILNDVPLLYSPYLSAPADDPNIPLRRASIEHDRIFGGQLKTVWDMAQLVGIETPRDTRWDLLADYYTERGPAIGTGGRYRGRELFGIPGVFDGSGLAYSVLDDGKDNLGADRRALAPEDNERWRVLLRHRHELPANTTVFGELGLLSDRNFLEQYFENEFDDEKDNETLVYIRQVFDNSAWTALVRPQFNNFENTTQWLPRGDLYALSEPLLNGWLTWSSHSYAGYADLHPAETPFDPTDVLTPLPFVAGVDGVVLMTRHELNLPLNLGPVNFVPYLMGEGAFWSEDFNQDEIDRFVGGAGIRSSVQFWRVFPNVHSRVFNLRGLAHKILVEADYGWTDSSEDLANIPQYNEFDDNAQERFRQRLLVNTFGGTLPAVFEPRFYAVRTGAGASVTAPYHELIDDQQVARLALRQRLQTKVGPPERRRIRDWMTLDLEASYFPDSSRDNFGEDFGLLGGRYAWNVGSRTSLLANAAYDLFDDAQQLWNVAILTQRSRRGSVYLGIRQVKAASLDSQIVTASYSYRMSPKWISTFGTAFDVSEDRNAGQSLTITRVGLDVLVHFGANVDESKDNVGIAVSIEPRFGPFSGSSTQMSSLLGRR